MRILVTGSTGHLGEALVRVLRAQEHDVVGLDILPSPFTGAVASITDPDALCAAMRGSDAVLHAATLHKPHVATHTRAQFVDTNVHGTLNVLEAALAAGVQRVVMTSSTSVFGAAMTPPAGSPAAWIDETVTPIPKNIYGVTKLAAESLCELFARQHGLPVVVLRTSRFFPEADDARDTRERYADANVKVNEFLHRRADIEDIVDAHLLAMERAPALRFGRYIVSATTPFTRDDVAALRTDAAAVVRERVPACAAEYARRGWALFPTLDRVYDNTLARTALGWQPRHDFAGVLARLATQAIDADIRSPLAQQIGSKGYHDRVFDDGPYPV
ncbi:UDP-glucose 4-epimerase [Pseudoduganella flava]|uniref:NAD-dependent epimerase/dehydratase family protein n=1 Tax=Pseudoduganella flava TaxID=871742 RepID=A0A562P9B6_9BURK|nr:NAD(P)-dependent oxidoreductase [Pseudoduganella flava]QGZ42745.1 NAD-dependent epimerase/dehydratase family protein [Pseudoduganella flava]TWI41001.1 UDP-glucose 4-epimerase [Pseudoduganella flava]